MPPRPRPRVDSRLRPLLFSVICSGVSPSFPGNPFPPSGGSSGVAPEPWPPLSGGAFSGAPAPLSPDPLVRYRWPLAGGSVNDSVLQIYELPAVSVGAGPGTSPLAFSNSSSAIGSVSCAIRVVGAGTLIFDFGVEAPAWWEFDSPDLPAETAAALRMGSGEYNSVGFYAGYKSAAPTRYCRGARCTYRLETNPELYEGKGVERSQPPPPDSR